MSRYARKDAKDYARTHLKGIWAAALTPFTASFALDEDGFRENIRHWTQRLGIDGLFIAGKQGEFFSMSLQERKRAFELAVEATPSGHHTILSCSDQNLDAVMELEIGPGADPDSYVVRVLHSVGAGEPSETFTLVSWLR